MDLKAEAPDSLVWNSGNTAQSLEDLRKAAESVGQQAIDWYWSEKGLKSLPSKVIRFAAVTLTALAGLIPILVQLLKGHVSFFPANLDTGPFASICVGIAAALLGLDKAFGYSTGWIRYVLTATLMTKQLREFRLDWVAATAPNPNPTPEQQVAIIQRARDFVSEIQGAILQETKDWAAEFQSNMAQMDKDLKVQLESLKTEVDKTAKDKEAAAKPGAIELTVPNADKTDGFSFAVTLQGPVGKTTEQVTGSKAWTRIGLTAGQYSLGILAKKNGKDVSTPTVVEVKPGETLRPSVMLPISDG